MFIPSRREILKIGVRSLASFGALSAMGKLGEMNALASGSPNYKALVCIFLFGGNDPHNTVVPINTPLQTYANYQAVRQSLALAQGSLLPITTKNGAVYGLHPKMPELQALYQQNRVALLANTGMLVQPTTRALYQAQAVPVPANLFSHSDQQDQWQTSFANNLTTTGWAGRAADINQAQNGQPPYPMVMTPSSCGLFCSGAHTYGTVAPPGNPSGLLGMNLVGKQTGFQQLLNFDNGLTLVQATNTVTKRGVADSTLLASALASTTPLQTVFPNSNIGAQLKQVASIINVRASLGLSKQIFFASLDGFDTHGGQLPTHDALLQQLSQAMSAFYTATVEMGAAPQVITFTNSEFGRTLQPSSGGGSDHAWGGHQMIMGGGVVGGDLYGTYPLLALNTGDDANTRGVMIPTTSVDQYGATLASWFGVNAVDLPTLFPNLQNFATKNLGFLG